MSDLRLLLIGDLITDGDTLLLGLRQILTVGRASFRATPGPVATPRLTCSPGWTRNWRCTTPTW